MPGMGDIMQQNPDLMKQFAQAAVGSMANNIREPPPMQPNIPRQTQQPQQVQLQLVAVGWVPVPVDVQGSLTLR